MIGRRGIITAGVLAGAMAATPAGASRAPRAKDQAGYTLAIDRLFAAWWARDFGAFQPAFENDGLKTPFDGRALFEAHYVEREARFRGALLFNGPQVAVQVVTPQGPDHRAGILGGYAVGDLYLVKFYPGIDRPVMESVAWISADILAHEEWIGLPGAVKE